MRTYGVPGRRGLEAHGLPVGGLDVLEVVGVALLVVALLTDLLLEQAHRVPGGESHTITMYIYVYRKSQSNIKGGHRNVN